MGREDLALATLDRAARLTPTDGDLQAERALLFSLMGWFLQARQALQLAAQRQADPLRMALVRATMARQERDLRTARRELETAQHQYPNDPELRIQQAAVAASEGRIAEATQELEAVTRTEADPDVWVALAKLRLRDGSGDDTRADERRRAASHSVARARGDLQRALALRPEMPAARQLMGRCLRLSGELAEARSILERLDRERPRQEGVAFDLAQVYRALGMADRVGPLMARYQVSLRQRAEMRRAALAVMAHPDSAPAHRDVGLLCLKRGMIGRALLSLERAATLDPRLPGVREGLADARRAGGAAGAAAEAETVDLGG
jgi:tetratricopeptide (TPR) repeat protein